MSLCSRHEEKRVFPQAVAEAGSQAALLYLQFSLGQCQSHLNILRCDCKSVTHQDLLSWAMSGQGSIPFHAKLSVSHCFLSVSHCLLSVREFCLGQSQFSFGQSVLCRSDILCRSVTVFSRSVTVFSRSVSFVSVRQFSVGQSQFSLGQSQHSLGQSHLNTPAFYCSSVSHQDSPS